MSLPSLPRHRAGQLAGAGLLVTLAGMLLSNPVMSIGSGLLLLAALAHPDRAALARRFLRDPVALSLTLVFWLYLLGGLLVIGALYAARFGYYTEHYTQGSVMPTPVNHIRYSLLLAFAAACGGWLAVTAEGRDRWDRLWSRFRRPVRAERAAWALAALVLAAFLHVLAVRSGLVALYAVALYGLGRWALVGRRWIPALVALVLAAGAVALAVRHVPTLHNRIGYARYDLERFSRGEVNPDLSDAKRIGSILAGLELVRTHPWTGVGTGDLTGALRPVYARRFPDLAATAPLPHNQFVLVAAALGIPGLLVFGWALAAPWFAPGLPRDGLFVVHQIVLLPSMLTEATLETQYGVTLYLFFVLLFLRRLR
jgi:O-antigen ligase